MLPSPLSLSSSCASLPLPYHSQSEIDQIIFKLSQQSLAAKEQPLSWELPTPPLDQNDREFDMQYEADSIARLVTRSQTAPSTPSHASVSCRRLQRQLNVQLQSSTSHIRDIDSLVSEMISSSSQCRLRRTPSRQIPANPHPPPNRPLPYPLQVCERPYRLLHLDQALQEGDRVFDGRLEANRTQYHNVQDGGARRECEAEMRPSSTPSGIRKSLKYRRSHDGTTRPLVSKVPRMRRHVTRDLREVKEEGNH